MDRDNARDTRAPSNRDVRLRRRTGLGGALVTGRALRRRSLNALSTRARHVHRHRQSSFAPSSPPFIIPHHPSRGYAGPVAIARSTDSSPPPVDATPRASTKTPRKTLKKFFHVPSSIGPRRHPSRASSLDRDRRASKPPPRDRPRARAFHSSHAFARGRSCARVRTHPLRTGTAVHDGQRAARDARRGRRRSRRHLRADDGGSHGESVHRGESLCVGVCGGGRPGARRREGTSTSRDSTMCARRAGGRACVIAQCVRDGCAWGLCMERERDSYWTTAYPVYRRGRARALYASPSTVSHDR